MIFKRCREFGVSLNPNKYIFIVNKVKLLGHIISKEGIQFNMDRTKAIL